jgi:hypothetical protein
MSQEPRLSPTKEHVETMLGQLQPNAQLLDQDVLMFKSGQASVGCKNRPWQVISGLLMLLLCASLVTRPEATMPTAPTVAPEQSFVETMSVSEVHANASFAYLKLQQTVLQEGLDALPARKMGGPQESRNREILLNRFLSSDESSLGLL